MWLRPHARRPLPHCSPRCRGRVSPPSSRHAVCSSMFAFLLQASMSALCSRARACMHDGHAGRERRPGAAARTGRTAYGQTDTRAHGGEEGIGPP